MSEKRVKPKITNSKQFERLVSFMEKHKELARGLQGNKEICRKLWVEIANNLNCLGPPIKKVAEWQKVWSDFKLKIRKKLGENKKEMRATGGGPSKLNEFTSLEEAVISLLSLDNISSGGGTSYGLISTEMSLQMLQSPQNDDDNSIMEIEEQSLQNINELNEAREDVLNDPNDLRNTLTKRTTRTPLKSKYNERRETLLEEQTKVLKSIADDVKEIARYSRKKYYLKEKKIKLYEKELKLKEDKEKRRQKDNIEINKLKLEILEYKRRKLDLEKKGTKH